MNRTGIDQHPMTYMGIRGLLYGGVCGALYGTLLAPVVGTIAGAFLGLYGGFVIGIAVGLLIHLVTTKSLYVPLGYRKTLTLIGSLAGFFVVFVSLMTIFLFWDDMGRLFSDNETFVELFAQLALIPALITAFCSAYISNNYAKRYFENRSHQPANLPERQR